MTARFLAPEFHVQVNGSALAAEVSKNIIDLSVTLAAGAIDALRLTLANPYPELRWTHTDDASLFAVGNGVVVKMGYTGDDEPETMFDGEITGLRPSFPESGAPTLEIEGMNRLHRLQQKSDLITLRDATDGDLVKKIAGASHLSAEVDDPGTTHPQLSTGRAPHLQFLTGRGKVLGREVWVDGTTLHFAPREIGEPVYVLVWGRTRASDTADALPLQSFSPTLDARKPIASVVVRGQDPLTREVIEGKAGSASGDDTLGGPHELVVTDEPVVSLAEAEARAKSIYEERAMEYIQGSGATLGLPRLRAGTLVELDGLGPRFNGRYRVTSATHSMGGGGYRTSFHARRNPDG